MTNGDRLRSSDNREIAKRFMFPEYCVHEEPRNCKREEWINGLSPCRQCLLAWLDREEKPEG